VAVVYKQINAGHMRKTNRIRIPQPI